MPEPQAETVQNRPKDPPRILRTGIFGFGIIFGSIVFLSILSAVLEVHLSNSFSTLCTHSGDISFRGEEQHITQNHWRKTGGKETAKKEDPKDNSEENSEKQAVLKENEVKKRFENSTV